MAIVIHEFEVEVQPEAPAAEAASTPAAPPTPQPGALKIERAVRRQMERSARIWAH